MALNTCTQQQICQTPVISKEWWQQNWSVTRKHQWEPSQQLHCSLLPIFITAGNAELPGKVSEKRRRVFVAIQVHLNSISTLRTPALKQCLLTSAVAGHQAPPVKYMLWSLIVENHLLAIRIGFITVLDLHGCVGRQNPDSEWRHPPSFLGELESEF